MGMKRIIILLIAMLFIGTVSIAGSVLYISNMVTRPLTIEHDTFSPLKRAVMPIVQLNNLEIMGLHKYPHLLPKCG